MTSSSFIDHPGRDGAFGALMDEYVRAAEDFCRVVEAFDPTLFRAERESADADTRSPYAIAAHVCGAARRYADYIDAARRGGEARPFALPLDRLHGPTDVRPLLAEGMRFTESVLEGFFEPGGLEVAEGITFQVRWGPTYDPEMLLEHAIVHLLRHRRQLERW